jgi:hypothetical protein
MGFVLAFAEASIEKDRAESKYPSATGAAELHLMN